jgi:ferredoxin--NADP+ reductase
MSAFNEERVLSVHHWTDTLFTFTTTRDQSLRFSNGHFTMIGLRVNDKPLLRAYSIVSPNHDEHLEFLSIKVQDGPLTSRLQHIKVGDTVIVGRKPTGTLLIDYLLPGKRLYMLSTGTGLAPFMSIIRDPATYEQYEQVVLVHGVRQVNELAYQDLIVNELPKHEFLGEMIAKHLLPDRDARGLPQHRPGDRPDRERQADGRPEPAGPQPGGRPRHDLRQPRHAERSEAHARRARLQRRQHGAPR